MFIALGNGEERLSRLKRCRTVRTGEHERSVRVHALSEVEEIVAHRRLEDACRRLDGKEIFAAERRAFAGLQRIASRRTLHDDRLADVERTDLAHGK